MPPHGLGRLGEVRRPHADQFEGLVDSGEHRLVGASLRRTARSTSSAQMFSLPSQIGWHTASRSNRVSPQSSQYPLPPTRSTVNPAASTPNRHRRTLAAGTRMRRNRSPSGRRAAEAHSKPRADIAPEYTGVVVTKKESVSMDLTVTNGGRQDEDIEVTIPSVPKGWKARIRTYSFGITGVHVASDKSKSLTLKLDPEAETEAGKYVFPVKAVTQDGKLSATTQITVLVKEGEKDKEAAGSQYHHLLPGPEGPDGRQVRVLPRGGKQDGQGGHLQPERPGPRELGDQFQAHL